MLHTLCKHRFSTSEREVLKYTNLCEAVAEVSDTSCHVTATDRLSDRVSLRSGERLGSGFSFRIDSNLRFAIHAVDITRNMLGTALTLRDEPGLVQT